MRLPAYGSFRHSAVDMLSCVSFGGAANIVYPSGLIGGPAWSWAGFVWLASLGSTRTLLSEATTAGAPNVEVLTTGAVRIRPHSGSNLDSPVGVVAAKTWVHVAVSVAPLAGNVGFDYIITVNGEVVLQGRSATGVFAANAGVTTMTLGSGSRVCRVAVWSTALTQAQMRAHYYADTTGGASLVWPLDDAEGSRGADAVAPNAARELIVTIGSGGFWSTDTPKWAPRQQQAAGSVLLDGVENTRLSAVDGAALPQLVGCTGLSVMAWCRPRFASGSTVGALVLGRSGTSPGSVHFYLDARNSSTRAQARMGTEATRDSGVTGIQSQPLPMRGTWRLVGMTIDPAGTWIRQYHQGMQISRVAAAFSGVPFSIPANPNDFSSLHIGEDTGGTPGSKTPFNGWIGPAWIFDTLLTRQQMRAMYLKGECGVAPAFQWRMDERIGTTAASTGKFAAPLTLNGGAAWSMDAP